MAKAFKRSQVVGLLVELGADKAKTEALPMARLESKLEKLPETLEKNEDLKPKTADGKKLLKLILKAVEDEELELEDDTKPTSDKKSTKAKAKAKDEDEEEEDEEEDEEESSDEDEDEDEEESEDEEEEESDEEEEEASDEDDEEEEEEDEDEKPAKKSKKDKKKGKKGGGEAFKKVGIVDDLRKLLEKATEKKPLSLDAAIDVMSKKYPDRDPAKMRKTAQGQYSYFFRHKEGLNVQNVPGKGYYIAEGKFKGVKRAEKEEKKADKKGNKSKKAKSKKSKDEDDE